MPVLRAVCWFWRNAEMDFKAAETVSDKILQKIVVEPVCDYVSDILVVSQICIL